jgi:hypothetical protein
MCSYSPLRCHLLHARNMPGSRSQSAEVSEQAVWQLCPHMGDECPRPNIGFIGQLEGQIDGVSRITTVRGRSRLAPHEPGCGLSADRNLSVEPVVRISVGLLIIIRRFRPNRFGPGAMGVGRHMGTTLPTRISKFSNSPRNITPAA